MRYRAMLEELRAAAAAMDLAAEAGEAGDWHRAEQGLLEVQERNARLLREVELGKLTQLQPRPPKRAA